MEQKQKSNTGIIMFLVILTLVFASVGSWQTVENQQNKATVTEQATTIADLEAKKDSLISMSDNFSQQSQTVIADFQNAVTEFVQKLEKYKDVGDSLQINITTTSGKVPILNITNKDTIQKK